MTSAEERKETYKKKENQLIMDLNSLVDSREMKLLPSDKEQLNEEDEYIDLKRERFNSNTGIYLMPKFEVLENYLGQLTGGDWKFLLDNKMFDFRKDP